MVCRAFSHVLRHRDNIRYLCHESRCVSNVSAATRTARAKEQKADARAETVFVPRSVASLRTPVPHMTPSGGVIMGASMLST